MAAARREPPAYSVYVVELDPACCTRADCPGGPHVYVGQTALTPEQRLARHRDPKGGTRPMRSTVVTRHGLALRPDLAGEPACPTRDEAEAAERRLALALRARGMCVFSDGLPRSPAG